MKLDSIQKTLPLLLLMTMGNWACSDNDPVEEVETETVPDNNQTTLGRIAIDEGADLVCCPTTIRR